jgi:hypothetical protein
LHAVCGALKRVHGAWVPRVRYELVDRHCAFAPRTLPIPTGGTPNGSDRFLTRGSGGLATAGRRAICIPFARCGQSRIAVPATAQRMLGAALHRGGARDEAVEALAPSIELNSGARLLTGSSRRWITGSKGTRCSLRPSRAGSTLGSLRLANTDAARWQRCRRPNFRLAAGQVKLILPNGPLGFEIQSNPRRRRPIQQQPKAP